MLKLYSSNFNMFKAAQEESCSRVVFASSTQVIEGYPIDTQINPDRT